MQTVSGRLEAINQVSPPVYYLLRVASFLLTIPAFLVGSILVSYILENRSSLQVARAGDPLMEMADASLYLTTTLTFIFILLLGAGAFAYFLFVFPINHISEREIHDDRADKIAFAFLLGSCGVLFLIGDLVSTSPYSIGELGLLVLTVAIGATIFYDGFLRFTSYTLKLFS